jgi:predicted Zn-dependent protease
MLPAFFNPVLNEYGLSSVEVTSTNQMRTAVFNSAEGHGRLELTVLECNRPQQVSMLQRICGGEMQSASTNSVNILSMDEDEFEVEFSRLNGTSHHVAGFAHESSIQIWDITGGVPGLEFFKTIRPLVNRQRYEEAHAVGNVSMGHWADQIHDYATWLLASEEKKKAVAVLKNHLKTTSFDYEAHVDFFEATDDASSASNSAWVVYRNAIDYELIEKAAAFLGKPLPAISNVPVLSRGEKGLQLILVPLPPCNMRVLADAASIFEEITDVPTKVCRLGLDWEWHVPNRVHRERDIQKMLVKIHEGPMDFEGWDKGRYIGELERLGDTSDYVLKYYMKKWVEMVEEEPGQYRVDPYLLRLNMLLAQVRSDDSRTMYVGVTEVNIYSGDNEYVFSQGYAGKNSGVGLMSYYMMQGVRSRSQLAERIGKELVPAALKQLEIERSVDPSCPYSYANGVGRLDEKTKNLAEPVKQALSRVKLDSR